MDYEFRELKPEDVEVGDLYLAPSSYMGNTKLVSARIAHVYDKQFNFSTANKDIGSSSFSDVLGILVKRNGEGKLEFCVSREFLEAFKKLDKT